MPKLSMHFAIEKRKRHFKRLLNKHEQSVENLAFLGSQHPRDWEAIRSEYRRTRKALVNYICNAPQKTSVKV